MSDQAPNFGRRGRAAARLARLRRLRRIPLRYVLPNLVTLLALCLGLTAIRLATEAQYENAVMAIVAAAILDGLDGRIARALHGASRFGAELDSLADFVDFGVAPALLLYFWSLRDHRSLGWIAALIFVVACALRLARFNVLADDKNSPAWMGRFFVGMPAPAGAITAMLPLYLHFAIGLPDRPWVSLVEIAYLLAIAFLMASRIPHFSGKKIGRVPREWLLPVLLGFMATLLLVAAFPTQMLAALSLAYLGLIPVSIREYRRCVKAQDEAAKAETPPAP